ncbi:MAG: acyloxyacyl hydrolase [Pseudomonadota bacterium]|nr:acyloxyacyl hydrolase [Pseudomonadota bacterium]
MNESIGPIPASVRWQAWGLRLAFIAMLLVSALVQAQSPLARVESVGLQGQSAFKHFDGLQQQAVSLKLDVHAVEIPRQWLPGRVRLNAVAGTLRAREQQGAIVSIGPEWTSPQWLPVEVSVGLAPTWLSESQFAGDELGGHFHFTSHLAVGGYLDEARRLELRYRVQHISNGGIRRDNPGVDMAGAELRYRFGQRRPAVLRYASATDRPTRAGLDFQLNPS